jgi:hypothetical protein
MGSLPQSKNNWTDFTSENDMQVVIVVLLLLPAILCLGLAAWLCFKGKDGWGWFLFVGLLLGSIAGSAGDPFIKITTPSAESPETTSEE